MVIPERVNQVAYYYRTTHRDHGYEKYIEPGKTALEERYGAVKKKEHFFWDEGSGADGSRKEFLRLMEEVKKGHIHVIVTRDAAMIARDWKQFLKFMKICDRANVDVVSINREADAWEQYSRIRQFIKDYFEGEALA